MSDKEITYQVTDECDVYCKCYTLEDAEKVYKDLLDGMPDDYDDYDDEILKIKKIETTTIKCNKEL